MSLINDMLKDLRKRNYPLAGITGHGLPESNQKHANSYSPQKKGFWSLRSSTLAIAILMAGVALGGTVLLQPAQLPDQVLAASVKSNLEPIRFTSQNSGPRPRVAKVRVDAEQSRALAGSIEQVQPARISSFTESVNVILPKYVQPPKRVSASLNVSSDRSEEKKPHNISQPLDVLQKTKVTRPLATTINTMAAQTLNRSGSVTAIMPKYIMPPEKIRTSPDANADKSAELKSPKAIESTRTASQKSDPLLRVSTSKVTASQLPQSANTEETGNSAYIEVTHRPLSAEQQLLNSFRVATEAYKQGNYAETERLLEDILARDKGQHMARLLLARLYARQKLDSSAELVLTDGLLDYPQYSPYVSLYAQMLAEQGRDIAAIETLQNGLPGAGDNADYHALLAGLYQRTGNSDAAVKSYLTALRLDSTRGEWWMGLGISSEQAGNEDAGKNAYNEALQYPLTSKVEQYVQQRLSQLAAKKSPDTRQKSE